MSNPRLGEARISGLTGYLGVNSLGSGAIHDAALPCIRRSGPRWHIDKDDRDVPFRSPAVQSSSVAHESGLRDYPADVFDARDQLDALLSSYSRYELDTHHNLKSAQEIGDSESAALLQVISDSVENNLWFLEAYLEGIAVGLHG